MATTKLSDEEFWAFLEKHPDLRDRFASIVSAVENSEGNLKEAAVIETSRIAKVRSVSASLWIAPLERAAAGIHTRSSRLPANPGHS